MKPTEKNMELAIAEAIIKLLRDGIDRYSSRHRLGYAIHHILYDLHPGIVHHFDDEKDDTPTQLQTKIDETIESVAVFLGKSEVEKAKLKRKLAGKDHKIKLLKAEIRQVQKEKKVLSS